MNPNKSLTIMIDYHNPLSREGRPPGVKLGVWIIDY